MFLQKKYQNTFLKRITPILHKCPCGSRYRAYTWLATGSCPAASHLKSILNWTLHLTPVYEYELYVDDSLCLCTYDMRCMLAYAPAMLAQQVLFYDHLPMCVCLSLCPHRSEKLLVRTDVTGIDICYCVSF